MSSSLLGKRRVTESSNLDWSSLKLKISWETQGQGGGGGGSSSFATLSKFNFTSSAGSSNVGEITAFAPRRVIIETIEIAKRAAKWKRERGEERT